MSLFIWIMALGLFSEEDNTFIILVDRLLLSLFDKTEQTAWFCLWKSESQLCPTITTISLYPILMLSNAGNISISTTQRNQKSQSQFPVLFWVCFTHVHKYTMYFAECYLHSFTSSVRRIICNEYECKCDTFGFEKLAECR